MTTSFRCRTLRGNLVQDEILISREHIEFTPVNGNVRQSKSLAVLMGAGSVEFVSVVKVCVTEHGVVLVPSTEEACVHQELVLVKEYENGCGRKRYPGFSVNFGEGCQVLSEARTDYGSGSETWSLVVAPMGWAENIASQFVDEKDVGGQKISYSKPKPFGRSLFTEDQIKRFRVS